MQDEPSPSRPIPFGRYELIRRIGAGGMGEVFLARVSGTPPRVCVVKKVLPHLARNQAFVGRFLDEAKVVVRLKHPNIARVYAMGEVSGEYFLAMEYVEGKTVSRFTRRLRERQQTMSLGLVLLLGERVCRGLAYAHEAKDESGQMLHLVHRDLSPANVCVSYLGEVKIIDFGAAQSTLKVELTAPRVVIGNLTYMAPEQAKKQNVDRRADVYSLGVTLWELLAASALPQTGDPVERWRKAANPNWKAPSVHHPDLPRAVDKVVLKALRRAPGERFGDAKELGAELQALLSRYAPTLTEKDLGGALSAAFAPERSSECEVLNEALGESSQGGATLSDTRREPFVPSTSLAFEHEVLAAPANFVPAAIREATKRFSRVSSTRMGFGVALKERTAHTSEQSLVQEIEAAEAQKSARFDIGHPLVYAGVFAVATLCGFLGWVFATR